MNDAALLAFHCRLVAIPSISRDEAAAAAFLAGHLAKAGWEARPVGNSLFAAAGRGPVLVLNSHIDTVPPSPRWTRPPFTALTECGRVFGLGSTDAKASVAALTAAFLRLAPRAEELGLTLVLALAAEEEVGGGGSTRLAGELVRRGLPPWGVIVGEPTGLEIAAAQKGLLVLELVTAGDPCHAAHGRALEARNAIHALASDLVALRRVDFGPPHPLLGPVTVEPTLIEGGTVRNMLPAEARCFLDVRTNPEPDQQATAARLAAAVEGDLRVVSDRRRPIEIEPGHPLVRAAQAARPASRLFGSRGLSDLAFWPAPGIKVGPGLSERSHTADEFVEEAEILDGAHFYVALIEACAAALDRSNSAKLKRG